MIWAHTFWERRDVHNYVWNRKTSWIISFTRHIPHTPLVNKVQTRDCWSSGCRRIYQLLKKHKCRALSIVVIHYRIFAFLRSRTGNRNTRKPLTFTKNDLKKEKISARQTNTDTQTGRSPICNWHNGFPGNAPKGREGIELLSCEASSHFLF